MFVEQPLPCVGQLYKNVQAPHLEESSSRSLDIEDSTLIAVFQNSSCSDFCVTAHLKFLPLIGTALLLLTLLKRRSMNRSKSAVSSATGSRRSVSEMFPDIKEYCKRNVLGTDVSAIGVSGKCAQ
uniref:Uncharacterized protein n=1 Tax=Timema monikensis TaxID=170555 RepID=A0A7R9EJG1_9NEOP|nr:unnamed protein product [Timema monikensis]